MRIALFVPCFNDAFFPATVKATVRVLERLGLEVRVPRGQTCCGQVHFNTGYRREALHLMRRFLDLFSGNDAVVAPSASCVAMVREHYAELASWVESGPRVEGGRGAEGGRDARSRRSARNVLGYARSRGLAEEVRSLASRTFELSEFLVHRLGVEDVGAAFPHRVTLHTTCHSLRGIHVGDAPLRLLRAVRGLTLLDLPGALECCGFGGTFSVKNPHTSLAMMEDKLRSMRDTGAEVLTAVDNSCLLHLMGGMHRAGWLAEDAPGAGSAPRARKEENRPGDTRCAGAPRDLRVMHLAEILVAEERR
jgi:L-lactate dehydrogenase complex protein LldE